MNKVKSDIISAKIEIIGINPFVYLPDNILNSIFVQAKRDKGYIPIKGIINGNPYKQTLVKYSGEWRLYINNIMLKNSPKRIGETVELSVEFDSVERVIEPNPNFLKALNDNKGAKQIFENLTPSLQKEIIRYISLLKRENSIAENIEKAIGFLQGKNKFIGREPIKINKNLI